MYTFFKFLHLTGIVSLVASFAAAAVGSPRFAVWLGAPALLFSAWAFVGHLVTIDDDYPGGFSNPQKSQALWSTSVRALGMKFLAFVAIGAFVWRQALLG